MFTALTVIGLIILAVLCMAAIAAVFTYLDLWEYLLFGQHAVESILTVLGLILKALADVLSGGSNS